MDIIRIKARFQLERKSPSQQISFGKKRTKRVAREVAKGIANFCMQGMEAKG